MKSKILMLLMTLAVAGCAAASDGEPEGGGTDPASSATVTTAVDGEPGTEGNAEPGDQQDGTTSESTTVLQSGSSTSLATTTTFQVFETDPNETYAVPVEDIPPGQNPVYYTEFEVDQGEVQIVWDRWWWGLLDGKGEVRVYREGELMAEGFISGEGAVQSQDPSTGTISIYGANGDVVATVTQEDLTESIRAAQAEANIG